MSTTTTAAPAFPSTAYLTFGFLAMLAAFALFAGGSVSNTGGILVAVMAAAFAITGQLMLAIGVIAKGVSLGNRESR